VKRSTRAAAVVVLGLLAATGVPGIAVADPGPCRRTVSCPVPVVDHDGYEYSYDGGDIVAAPVLGGSPGGGQAMEFLSIPACQFNRPPSGDGRDPGEDAMCPAASNAPRCAAGEIRMRVYARRAGSADGWRFVGDRCVRATTRVPVAEVLAGVAEQLAARLVTPRFAVQPRGRALVNLPVIVHVTAEGRRVRQRDCAHPQGVCFDTTVPVPGRLEAAPSYRWVFDGNGAVGEGRGRAYDGTSPRESPDHYVAHAYPRASATETVQLTVLWQATFTVAGLPPLELADLPKTARESFRVVEARSQLVAG
jgi:hypothetical protein